MPISFTEKSIPNIIENFDANIDEYEIIDMEDFKGWSSKYLYLIPASNENYILKGKTSKQIKGYENEVRVSQALIKSGISTRKPILTKSGKIFHKQDGYYWSLMTYIPGATAKVEEFKDNTVVSLAKHIDQYITASMEDENLKNLKINKSNENDHLSILDNFINEKKYLYKKHILDIRGLNEFYSTIKNGYKSYIDKRSIKTLLHNDINPRNILIDHTSKDVISLIDWDHVTYGNPLKDVSDAVAIFYDFLPKNKASQFTDLFYDSFKSSWFSENDKEILEFSFLFYYTVAKWRASLYYLRLLKKFGNKYNEEERFIREIQQSFNKWKSIIKQ